LLDVDPDIQRGRPHWSSRSLRARRPGNARVAFGALGSDGSQRTSAPTGEIVTRGPQVFAGYADGRAASFHEGWLRSGDLGRIGAGALQTASSLPSA
jgi:long-subunit acyl-CoA synthetase (AMP-forming)